MGWIWTVTEAERDRVLRDAFRVRLTSGIACVIYVLDLAIVVIMWLLGGWLAAVPLAIFAALSIVVVAFIWYRQIRRLTYLSYPVGATVTSELVDGRLRLADAVGTTEIGLDHLRKPRVVGSVVSVIPPAARLRRTALPRVLFPDEALAAQT